MSIHVNFRNCTICEINLIMKRQKIHFSLYQLYHQPLCTTIKFEGFLFLITEKTVKYNISYLKDKTFLTLSRYLSTRLDKINHQGEDLWAISNHG